MNFIKNLFKQRVLETDLLQGAVEVHCHLLPGVDDGVQELDQSVEILKWMSNVGFEHICLTPHIMTDWPKNNYNFLNEKLKAFKAHVPSGMSVSLAAEYMLDSDFEARMQEPVLTYDGKHLLVETSYMAATPNMKQLLYNLQVKGFIPIFAHPERYVYLNTRELMSLKEDGLLFQLNLMSLCGAYGSIAQKKAEFLLKQGAYDFVGTDTHSFNWLKNGFDRLKLNSSTIDTIRLLYKANRALMLK